MGHIRISFVIGLVVILAACVAPQSDLPQIDPELAKREALIQRKMVLESAIELDIRLAQIARPMWIAAAPLCGKRISPTFGFYYTNQHEWGGEWLRAADDLYGLSDSLQVFYLEPGSPVDQAGFQAGDLLSRIPQMDCQFDDLLGRFCYKNQCNTIIATGQTRLTLRVTQESSLCGSISTAA